MIKLVFFVSLLPCALAFFLANFFGARKLKGKELLEVNGLEAATRVLKGSGIEVVKKKSWWVAINPVVENSLSLSHQLADSNRASDVAQVLQICGLALLGKVHPASVRQRYRAVKFASLFPAFVWVLAILMMAVRRLPPSACLAVSVVGLALACIALLVNLAVEREAAKRVIILMEKNGVVKRLSQQERLEEMILGRAYLNLFPSMFHGFMVSNKEKKTEL